MCILFGDQTNKNNNNDLSKVVICLNWDKLYEKITEKDFTKTIFNKPNYDIDINLINKYTHYNLNNYESINYAKNKLKELNKN